MYKVPLDKTLKYKNPSLAEEWHPNKNAPLTPIDISFGSSKKVWWQCSKFSHHVWDAEVGSRSRGAGCPYCSGNKASQENSLATRSPAIAKEWHTTKNKNLTPLDITNGSKKKVWWQCSKFSHHVWDAQVVSRTNLKQGCPYCANKRVSPENSLAAKFPTIARDWHSTKNGNLTPKDVTYGSTKRVYWRCSRVNSHIWETTVNDRTNYQTGCPFCTTQTSRQELRILAELKNLFSEVISQKKIAGFEVDIYLPAINLALEYDGSYYHLNKEKQDENKNKNLSERGIQLIRIREKPLKKISNLDILISEGNLKKSDLNLIIKKILKTQNQLNYILSNKLKDYLKLDNFINEIKFFEYVNCLPGPVIENSLSRTEPQISKEWHPKKNGSLTPANVTRGSSLKVWWQCSTNPTHIWDAIIADRTGKKSKCPFCSGKVASLGYSFADCHPEIAKQWHKSKNGSLKPTDFTPGSSKKVWWQCSKNPDHVWDAAITERTGPRQYGCPYCSGKRTSSDNCLSATFPELAQQWHKTFNGTLTPNDVTHGSTKRIWWQCSKNSDHVWDTTINARTNKKTGCPFCADRSKKTI